MKLDSLIISLRIYYQSQKSHKELPLLFIGCRVWHLPRMFRKLAEFDLKYSLSIYYMASNTAAKGASVLEKHNAWHYKRVSAILLGRTGERCWRRWSSGWGLHDTSQWERRRKTTRTEENPRETVECLYLAWGWAGMAWDGVASTCEPGGAGWDQMMSAPYMLRKRVWT